MKQNVLNAFTHSLTAEIRDETCAPQHIEALCQSAASCSPASVRSPLLRQRQAKCSDDEHSDKESPDQAENMELQRSRVDDPAPGSFQVGSGSPSWEGSQRSAAELTHYPLCEEGGPTDPAGVYTTDTVTLMRSEEESFGLDLEIMSSPLKVLVAGLKPGALVRVINLLVRWKSSYPLCSVIFWDFLCKHHLIIIGLNKIQPQMADNILLSTGLISH